jgi:hypothetical protein
MDFLKKNVYIIDMTYFLIFIALVVFGSSLFFAFKRELLPHFTLFYLILVTCFYKFYYEKKVIEDDFNLLKKSVTKYQAVRNVSFNGERFTKISFLMGNENKRVVLDFFENKENLDSAEIKYVEFKNKKCLMEIISNEFKIEYPINNENDHKITCYQIE